MIKRFLALSMAVLVTMWFVIGAISGATVERIVERDAIDKATHWAEYIINRVPDIETLAETGTPTDEQARIIREVSKLGEIFRFKLFDAEGRLALVSDQTEFQTRLGRENEPDPEPREVARTGSPVAEVFDGRAKPDRPDLYAEAYVPLIDPSGRTRGVVEVYVDETITRGYFQDSFREFGVSLALICTALFVLPAVAFALQRNVTQRTQENVDFLANYDALTGLLNRRSFVKTASKLHEKGELTAICYLDADRFKQVNDRYGHAAGDAFLVRIADVLRNRMRGDDLICRHGGDEFVIGFRALSLEAALTRARLILKECAEEITVDGVTVSGTVSIGIANAAEGGDFEEVLSHADAALYHAKSAGRNEVALYGDSMGDELRRRLSLETRLRNATRTHDFQVVYQPLIDCIDGETIGYEALLRMKDDDGNEVSPSTFIPIAEELGLIEDIGRWTLRTAARDIAALEGDLKVSVNLSAAQFKSGNLPRDVRRALDETGLAVGRLELEITETILLIDDPTVEMQIDALRDMGVSIAMDDFGTGFSSLSYLWKYGFDRLKIDRSFISGLDDNPERSREIIQTVLLLGQRLGMKVTAEGIETQAQQDVLSELGCDVLQGFLFGKPLPLAEQRQGPGKEQKVGTA